MNHEILIETEVDGAEPYAGLLRRVIPAALEAEGVSFPCEVDVLLTNDTNIHQINLDMREVDRATDVLSFPEFDLRLVSQLCGGERYKGRLLFSAGEKPYLSLRLKKGEDALRAARALVADYAAQLE